MTVLPVCFVVMPYGQRETNSSSTSAPAVVDFDALWSQVLSPELTALGYQAVRADQDLGGLIIKEMLERLTLSDLVVADTSLPNANVFYEIGIRHAAKQTHCVLMAAEWSSQPFDTQQIPRLVYPLRDGSVGDGAATELRTLLRDALPRLREGESPVFQSIPGYPNAEIDPTRHDTFRDFVDRLSAFQAKAIAIRRAPKSERERQTLELVAAMTPGPGAQWPSGVVLELLGLVRDHAGWEQTMSFIDALPEALKRLPFVQEQYVLAQAKHGAPLDAVGALETLITRFGDSAERQGLLGGRYKQLWKTATDEADRARYLDKTIEHYERGMYLDLNDYYPSCNLPRLYRLRGKEGDADCAATVAAVTQIACRRALDREGRGGVVDPWLRQTLLGAAFDNGDVTEARRLYTEIRKEGPVPWNLSSTMNDLEQSLAFHEEPVCSELQEVLRQLAVLA